MDNKHDKADVGSLYRAWHVNRFMRVCEELGIGKKPSDMSYINRVILIRCFLQAKVDDCD